MHHTAIMATPAADAPFTPGAPVPLVDRSASTSPTGMVPATNSPLENTPGKIVAMDDDPLTLRLLTVHLKKAGLIIETATNGTDGLGLVDETTAVALVDLRMPDLNGFKVLSHLQSHFPTVQVIILTGSDEVSDAVQAMRQGAFQYITKPFDPVELTVCVEKAVMSWQVVDENRDLKETHSHHIPARVVESTGDMHSRLMQQVDQVASLDSTVFIGGETGTGKSTIARMVHQKSSRAKNPFVTVNCASLPRDLIQSELFGHTKGSFTGAVCDRRGHAEVADGGTLFLDEIGDLPIDLQPKLLTFLQDRTVQRLGSAEVKKVNVRLIAATHRDLAQMCRDGLFRQDLYFRLLVLNLELPALRFRSGEFESIASGILESICQRQNIAPKNFSPSSIDLLRQHSWPGNIRELENVLERAVAFAKHSTIHPEDVLFSDVQLNTDSSEGRLPSEPNSLIMPNKTAPSPQQPLHHNPITSVTSPLTQPSTASTPQTPDVTDAVPPGSDTVVQGYSLLGKTLAEIERDAIIQTLASLGNNKAKTARTLGISEKSIYNKMRRHKISK